MRIIHFNIHYINPNYVSTSNIHENTTWTHHLTKLCWFTELNLFELGLDKADSAKITNKKKSPKRIRSSELRTKNFIVLSNAAVEVGQKDEDKIEERG